MRLTIQDRNELLKAAVWATDLESLKTWVANLADTIDRLPEGRSDAPVPPYRSVPASPEPPPAAPNGQAQLAEHWHP